MDIANLKPSERTIEITDPTTGENLGIRINMVSIDDDRLKAIKRKITDERLRLSQRNKSFSAEQIESNANKILWAAVTGWEWYGKDVTFLGEVPEFSQRNFIAVVEALPWFRDQLNEEIEDRAAFLGNLE